MNFSLAHNTTDHLRAVLFDYGGVFTGTPLRAFRLAAPDLGLTAEQLTALILGPLEHDTADHPWHQVERGEIAARDAIAAIKELASTRHGLDIEPLKLLSLTAQNPNDQQSMVDRVMTLRSHGVRTGLITNNLKEFSDHWRKSIPVDDLFEVVVDSCEVGVRKPSARIYELAVEALGEGLMANECAFVDDLSVNVAGAVAVGMTGVLVDEDKTSTFAWLDGLIAARQAG
jgi:putative hydrolase of the HAD superfamily